MFGDDLRGGPEILIADVCPVGLAFQKKPKPGKPRRKEGGVAFVPPGRVRHR